MVFYKGWKVFNANGLMTRMTRVFLYVLCGWMCFFLGVLAIHSLIINCGVYLNTFDFNEFYMLC